MSTLIFLSGGVDSAVLAMALAAQPSIYGQHTQGRTLHLLSYTRPEMVAKHRKSLSPLVKAIRDTSKASGWGSVKLTVEPCPLKASPDEDIPVGGHQTEYPLLSGYGPDRDSAPYTTGLHLWLASVALNLLAHEPLPPYGPREAFWGFQEDGPYWAAKEAGKAPSNDASEGWVASLNAMMGQTPTRTRFRAPFLENKLDRPQVVDLGLQLGTPFEHTSSCMYGWAPSGCGICHQCVRRARVFTSFGVKT